MINLISQIILVLSFGGLVFMVLRKMPLLAALSLTEDAEKPKKKVNFNVSHFKGRLPQREIKSTKFDEEDDYWEKVVK